MAHPYPKGSHKHVQHTNMQVPTMGGTVT
jgi:hypothetical protein